jgi:hypothetical protein
MNIWMKREWFWLWEWVNEWMRREWENERCERRLTGGSFEIVGMNELLPWHPNHFTHFITKQTTKLFIDTHHNSRTPHQIKHYHRNVSILFIKKREWENERENKKEESEGEWEWVMRKWNKMREKIKETIALTSGR